MSIESMMPSKHLILCRPLLLPSIFLSESPLRIRWPKYWSFSISPFNKYSGLIFFRMDWLDSLQYKGLSRVFSNATVQKHQFFGTQPSLWSNSHIHTHGLALIWSNHLTSSLYFHISKLIVSVLLTSQDCCEDQNKTADFTTTEAQWRFRFLSFFVYYCILKT